MAMAKPSLPPLFRPKLKLIKIKVRSSSSSTSIASTNGLTWDDVLQVPHHHQQQQQQNNSSTDVNKLDGFFERVKQCNRGSELKKEFMPFVIEERVAGYVHTQFAEKLRGFEDVFVFHQKALSGVDGSGYVTLCQALKSAEERTEAVGAAVKSLGGMIPGIRNELYPVTSSFEMPALFSLERAAAPYFGIKAYGVHMNGYVEKDGQKYLWIAKRSELKATYPGMLDHLVAGGLPHGLTCKENIIKECEEEAGIERTISSKAIPVGAVSYMDIEGYRYKRDFLFCYDLKLPKDFTPFNQDGEVESFKLIPVTDVADIIRKTEYFKPNCTLVIMDFLFRHGYIKPDDYGYLLLLQSLRSGDCY